ncbi:MAG TPA: glycosyltransferase family 39 protein [Herpetosiphonaceae bacterium]|nr:glycosyltransferase family 39 protein [Herpetosiphonaceae bacterium]
MDNTTHDPRFSPRTWAALALAGVLLLAQHARLSGLGERSLWFDEAFGAINATRPAADIIFDPACCHPPVSALLLRGWMALFGTGEVALRLPAVIAGLLAVAAVFWLGRRWFGLAGGLAAAGLAALSSSMVFYSREVNPYGLVLLLGAALPWLAEAAWDRPGRRSLAAFGAGSALALLTYYGFAIFLAAINAGLLAGAAAQARAEPGRRRELLGRLARVAACQLPGLALFGAYFLRYASGQAASAAAPSFSPGPLDFGRETFRFVQFLSVGARPHVALTWFWSALLALGLARCLRRRETLTLAVALLAALVLSYGLSSRGLYFYADRHTLFAAPLALLLIGAGVQTLSGWLGRAPLGRPLLAAGLAVALLLLVPRLPQADLDGRRTGVPAEQLGPVLECVASSRQPDDRIFVFYGAEWPFRYYNRRLGWPATVGRWARNDIAAQVAEASAALGAGRGWLVVAHDYWGEGRPLLDGLSHDRAVPRRCEDIGAWAVLLERP